MEVTSMRGGKLVAFCPRCKTHNDMSASMIGDGEVRGKLIEDQLYTMWEAVCKYCGFYYQTGVPYPAKKREPEETPVEAESEISIGSPIGTSSRLTAFKVKETPVEAKPKRSEFRGYDKTAYEEPLEAEIEIESLLKKDRLEELMAGDKEQLMEVARNYDLDMEITHSYIWPEDADMGKSKTKELLIGLVFNHDEAPAFSYGTSLFEMIHELGYGIRRILIDWEDKRIKINIGKCEEI